MNRPPNHSVLLYTRTIGDRASAVRACANEGARWVRVVALMMVVAVFASIPVYAETSSKPLPARIISINPSLSAILISLGQGHRLVGVDDFSARQIPEVAGLPRVGGLFNPSLEAVVALEPDLVVLVPSAEQRNFRDRLGALGIRVEAFENHQFAEVLENITRLGDLTGSRDAAAKRVAAIEQTRAAVERAVASEAKDDVARPSIAMVLQRDPLFVVGGANFIDTMVEIAGAENVAAQYEEAYPRVAMEWLVAASPQLLVDLSPEARVAMKFWERWPSINAVKQGRLISLDAELISMPGPHLDESLLLLARTFWGADIEAKIQREHTALATEAYP